MLTLLVVLAVGYFTLVFFGGIAHHPIRETWPPPLSAMKLMPLAWADSRKERMRRKGK